MSVGVLRSALVSLACLVWLTGCETTSTKLPDIFAKSDSPAALSSADPEPTGSLSAPVEPAADPATAGGTPPLLGKDPDDDLSVAKRHFRGGDFGLAERHFRRAVEKGPRDAEAWLGLAASYDRLKRFDLADRAYEQLLRLLGPTPEVLNNQGFSYMLRGDYARARRTLLAARAKDPSNPYIKNNMELLEKSERSRKAVQ